MKSLILALAMSVFNVVPTLGTETNGVFYIDNPVECHSVSQNGVITTNQLISGKTYGVSNSLLELVISNKTVIFFSGGPIIEANPKTVVTLILFDQEINNLGVQPRKAEFGTHTLNIGLGEGKFIVLNPSTDTNSSFTISTTIATYELKNGKFLFQIGNQKCLAYVLDGVMNVHGDKNRVDLARKGKLTIAGQLEDTIATTSRDIKQAENNEIVISVAEVEKQSKDVQFFIINGQIIGILMK